MIPANTRSMIRTLRAADNNLSYLIIALSSNWVCGPRDLAA